MQIHVNEAASNWYKTNLNLKDGDAVRFSGKIYGSSSGFSLAVMILQPTRPYVTEVVDGVTYYVEHGDSWYFEDRDLMISLDETLNEPKYELA